MDYLGYRKLEAYNKALLTGLQYSYMPENKKGEPVKPYKLIN